MTAADGLSRRGYPDPPSSLDDNDDLADCFIANIDPDVFDAVAEHESKIRKIDRASCAVLNYAALLPRRGPHILRRTLSVRLSVCLSVRPVLVYIRTVLRAHIQNS